MNELKAALEACVRSAAWAYRESPIGLNDLQNVYRQRRFGSNEWWIVYSSEATAKKGELTELVRQLRSALHEFIHPETDQIGNGLFDLTVGSFKAKEPTVIQFAENLLKPATLLGAGRVSELIIGWVNGEPLRFQQKVLLEGLNVEQTLTLAEGVAISKLPSSGAELPSSLPNYPDAAPLRYLGGVVLSLDCETRPALYLPPHSDQEARFGERGTSTITASGILAHVNVDAFCQSLSLASNHYVDWESMWTDLGDLQLFSQTPGGGGSYRTLARHSRVEFTQELLEVARDIYGKRYQPTKPKRGLDTAIRRWIGSKRRSSYVDQLIELRIALEALYLKNAAGEKQYRLATYGAWHLGNGFSERREVFRAIRKTYREASNALHAETVKPTNEHRETLRSAQDICRDGILRRLCETQEPEWDDLALGDPES